MGWFFEPSGTTPAARAKSFYGVVLDRVISGEYCDSLIRIPGGKP
ncbi:hypothetical protein PRIPAC_76300 [Pristionchus pacificus]|uniref:Uncharacterized protein n=1 Tax=Pristionchus pacificus TaxID=54126 RepID=A0A2A6B4S9_PRIPA|nr:hypothetical protein PRIPAC_76300 [Pristionchus pacificus]|eukprot:PDM60886.1 hypothetical protein PRIPAC_54692 [Pristionchus pacificus]